MACHAVSLIKSETIQGGTIQHRTVCDYVNVACNLFRDERLPSPCNADTGYTTTVLDAIKKFEHQPNCREMIHDKMVHHIEAQRANWGPDSLEAALTNWLYLGGLRAAGALSGVNKHKRHI